MKPETFRIWADILPEPCGLLRADGEILASNAPAARLGLQGSLLEWVLETEVDAVRTALLQAARTRTPRPLRLPTAAGIFQAHLALLQRTGDEAWLLLRITETDASRFVALNRQVEQLLTEIRRRRESEAALATERERLAVTLASIGDGVVTVDTEARVVLLNPIAEQLTGWTADEARGLPLEAVFRIFDERSGAPAVDPVGKVLRTGRIVGLANHTALEARDGTRRSIADSAAPIRAHDGSILGVVLVFRDVTHQHRIEEALARAGKLESLGLLAGGIAHDFNNILTAVLGNLSLAEARLPADHPVREDITEAVRAGGRAQDLTRQLLTFARGGAPIKRATSLDEILRETATFVLQGSSTALVLEVPSRLWTADVDAGQISQVVHNLVLNAHQAMPHGGRIIVRAANIEIGPVADLPLPPGPYLRVDIDDDGAGLPSEHLPRLFDPFFTTKPTGTGLGLTTVYSIVHRHGGHVEAQNLPEGGARFSFWVPVAASPPDTAPGPREPSPRQPLHVLVMDDNAVLRNLAAACLKQLGCTGRFTEDGEHAIEAYRAAFAAGRPFDVVLMDLTVPGGMGGLEAMARIRAIDPDVRAIVTSGYSSDPVLSDYREHGFAAVLPKPWRIEDLSRALATARRAVPV